MPPLLLPRPCYTAPDATPATVPDATPATVPRLLLPLMTPYLYPLLPPQVWFYRLEKSRGRLVNRRDYIGSVHSVQLNATTAAVLCESRVIVHPIEVGGWVGGGACARCVCALTRGWALSTTVVHVVMCVVHVVMSIVMSWARSYPHPGKTWPSPLCCPSPPPRPSPPDGPWQVHG